MRIIETKVFTFDELTDQAKEKARDWYREGALDYEWWDSVYEDAENVGLKISEFDLDRGSYVKAEFMASAEETAHKIEKEHGESCETFKDAKEYLRKRDEIVNAAPKNSDGELENEYDLDEKLEELNSEFLKTLQEDYRIMLNDQMEYLLSDESVDETIRANDYEFTESGERA